MKHKVSELEGALLDAAVAKAEGYVPDAHGYRYNKPPVIIHGVAAPRYVLPGDVRNEDGFPAAGRFHPSGDWKLAGLIIEREKIGVYWQHGIWVAGYGIHADDGAYYSEETGSDPATIEFDGATGCGPTLLIAAMRAFVASKFGEEVEL